MAAASLSITSVPASLAVLIDHKTQDALLSLKPS
jgi:hypothetical protein